MAPHYTYSATVLRVIDGDTVEVELSLGFFVYSRLSCRLYGCNAIELHDDGGPEARDHLAALLPVGSEIVVRSMSADKFAGRFDGLITLPNGRDATSAMIEDGYAAPWDGHGDRPVPAWPIPA